MTTATAKFSVLGDSDAPAVQEAEPKVTKEPLLSTDISHAEHLHWDSMPQALYSGMEISQVMMAANRETKTHSDLLVVDKSSADAEGTATATNKILLQQWRAVDQGILHSLPIVPVSNGTQVVEWLRSQSMNEATVQLAQALYCGTFPQTIYEEEDSSVAPFLGDILSSGGDGASFVDHSQADVVDTSVDSADGVVVESIAPQFETDTQPAAEGTGIGASKEISTTNPKTDAPKATTSKLLEKEVDDDATFVAFLMKQWKAVEEGNLRSFPIESVTSQQLVMLEDSIRDSGFGPTTLRYMQALYGLALLDSEPVEVNEAPIPTNEDAGLRTSTDVVQQAKSNALEIPSPVIAILQDGHDVRASREVVGRRLTVSTPMDEASELAALWTLVDAGTSRSLPMYDISAWSTASLLAFLDACTTSKPSISTVRLLDHIYGLSRHSDMAVQQAYAALVAQYPVDDVSPSIVEEEKDHLAGVHLLDTSNNSDKENELNISTDEEEEAKPTLSARSTVKQEIDDACIASADRNNEQHPADKVCDTGSQPTETTETESKEPLAAVNSSTFSKEEGINEIEPRPSNSDIPANEQETSLPVGVTNEAALFGEHISEQQRSKGTKQTALADVNQSDDKETKVLTNDSSGAHHDHVDCSLVADCLAVCPVLQEKSLSGESVGNGALNQAVGGPSSTVAPRLSRSNTPILSNRTADKEPHGAEVVHGNAEIMEKLVEEKQAPIGTPSPVQQLSTQQVKPSQPSYSEMAKKLAVNVEPASAPSTASPTRSLGLPDLTLVATSKPKSGKRFVASLSAVVNEGSSSVVRLTPAKTLETVDSRIIVLVSSQATHPEVIRQQTIVQDTLVNQGVDHVSVDGAHRDNKMIRNALFDVSGSRGEFPQIFVHDSSGQKVFWGGYDRFVADDELGVDLSSIVEIQRQEEAPTAQSQKRSVKFKDVKKVKSKQANKLSFSDTKDQALPAKGPGGRPPLPVAKMSAIKESAKSDITFYGATSFVAKHALDYMMQTSLTIPGVRKVTLAGRNEKKVTALKDRLKEKMANLCTVHSKASGKCLFDTFVAGSTDKDGLRKMCQKTKVVANFAGPFEKHSEFVVAACAEVGADYVDITGEVTWAGNMRTKYGALAEKSGARIISFCGFDSIPSDLAIFGAVDALRKKSGGQNVELLKGTCWHHCFGMANGGTIQTAVDMPLNLGRCLFRWVPFLLDDPLALTHPRVRVDPERESLKNQMAWTEWMNQLPSMDSIFGTGFSGPFFMAPVNTKIVHASSVALDYGPAFTYRERYIPVSYTATRGLGVLSIIPVLMVQSAILFASAVLKFPILGGLLARMICPPGTGSSDQACQQGSVEVYSEVETAKNGNGQVDRANCFLRFDGDPGNWATAQCICESALALVLDRPKLPPRSADGFGTPSELLGNVLLKRLKQTSVRPVEVATYVRKGTDPGVNFLCHFS